MIVAVVVVVCLFVCLFVGYCYYCAVIVCYLLTLFLPAPLTSG